MGHHAAHCSVDRPRIRSSLLANSSDLREEFSNLFCDIVAKCSSSGTALATLTFQLCFLITQWQEGLLAMVSSAPNQAS